MSRDRKALAEPVTQLLNDQPEEIREVGAADIDAVEISRLAEVKAGRRAPHRIEIEPFDRLLTRNDLLVTVAPAEPQQIVAERPGK